MNGKRLHLCDFDGTLTRGDSLLRFLWFAVPVYRLAAGCLVLIFKFSGLLLSGKWSNAAGKAMVFSVFLKGKTIAEMESLGETFHQRKLPGLLRTDLMEKLRHANQKGETVVIVSASADVWLRPFCLEAGFDILCTELEYESGLFTGLFATPNCNGAEKARRIRAAYALDSFDHISAYGNSKGDEAMFELADSVFKF